MLKAIDIDKTYKEKKILDKCRIEIKEGEIVSLQGKSGSGKTTLARILSLYEKADSGYVELDGEKLVNLKKLKGRIQLISQHPYSAFNPEKTIESSLVEGPLALKMADRKNALDYMDSFLMKTHVDKSLLSRYPREVSGGELQRIAIARALSVAPRVLICDEITSNLDPITTRELVENIKELDVKNLAILFITHQIDIARYIADRSYGIENSIIFDSYVF